MTLLKVGRPNKQVGFGIPVRTGLLRLLRMTTPMLLWVVLLASPNSLALAYPALRPPPPDPESLPGAGLYGGMPSLFETLAFEKISVNEGLSQNSVLAIAQDQQGFIWLGTQEGLNRYDGYELTTYLHDDADPDSLSNNTILALLVDSQGFLWVGTARGGVDRYDPLTNSFRHYPSHENDPATLSSAHITVLYEDQNGEIWVGTDGGGLNRLDPATGKVIRYTDHLGSWTAQNNAVILSIYEDRQGDLWIGTQGGGLNRLAAADRRDVESERFKQHLNVPGNSFSLSNNDVYAISEDYAGVLWVGTGDGVLHKYNRQTEHFIRYTLAEEGATATVYNPVRVILEDESGLLWAGLDHSGLVQFDPTSGRLVRFTRNPAIQDSLDSPNVRAVYISPEGLIWVGTHGGGVHRALIERKQFVHHRMDLQSENTLSSDHVTALIEDSTGMLWIGTSDKGLNRYDPELKIYTHYRHQADVPQSLSSDKIMSLFEDRQGTLWVGTADGGLNRYDRFTDRFFRYTHRPNSPGSLSGDRVSAIYEDRSGVLWVGTLGNGLNRFDEQRQRFIHYRHNPQNPLTLSSDTIQVIYEDQAGILWIGTDRGLNRFDRGTEIFNRFVSDAGDPDSLSADNILAIRADQSGRLWIGTDGGGLELFDRRTETFVHYRSEDGLADQTVTGMLEDGLDYLWVSTHFGLSRLDLQANEFRNFGVDEGLPPGGFSPGAAIVSRRGELIFGGVNGYVTFYPQLIREAPLLPTVVVTELAQGDKQLAVDWDGQSEPAITLKWPNNRFEFKIAALSFVRPEANQYAYILEGYDRQWHEIGTRRTGSYQDLPSGDYTLRVRGANHEGVWNEAAMPFRVQVTLPFWRSAQFQDGLVGGLVLALVSGFVFWVNRLKRQNRRLEGMVLQQTNELLRQQALAVVEADERSRSGRELHEAVTQSVYSASLIAEALPSLIEKEPDEGLALLGELRNLHFGALAVLRSLLLELHPTAIVDTSLPDLVRQACEAITARTGIEIRTEMHVQESEPLPEDLHTVFYRVAKEALDNAVTHARADTVRLSLSIQRLGRNGDSGLRAWLEVFDDGVGFDATKIPSNGSGLQASREQAQSAGAWLTVTSRPGEGTRVRVEWHSNGSSSTHSEA